MPGTAQCRARTACPLLLRMAMHLVRHIVAGADHSADSRRAVGYAGELAKALNATLTVVHVDEKAALVPGSDLARRELVLDAEAMDETVAELAARGVEARGVVRPGRPADGICALAREEGADLIVVGTQGRSCLAHIVLGSVAERVVREAPCPVVLVREPRADAG